MTYIIIAVALIAIYCAIKYAGKHPEAFQAPDGKDKDIEKAKADIEAQRKAEEARQHRLREEAAQRREAERHRQEIRARNARIEAARAQNSGAAPAPAEPAAPLTPSEQLYEPDQTTDHGTLAYYYDDVEIYCTTVPSPLCKVNVICELVPDPGNLHDKNAVKVVTIKKEMLGYLHKGKLQSMVNDYLKRGWDVRARVSAVDYVAKRVLIALAFYKPYSEDDAVASFKATVSEKSYDEYFSADVGEVVEAEYDTEKNAYLLDGVVKLPAKYEDYTSGEHFFVILDDEENESGLHSIKIGIFEEKPDRKG